MNKGMSAAVFLSGAGITLSLAPFNFWFLVFPCLAFFAWRLLECKTHKQAFFIAWLFGFGLNLASVCWVFVSIHFHGNTPLIIALFLTLIFCCFLGLLYGAAGYLFSRFFGKSNYALMLGFPAIMVIQEFVKTWLFTGFPWPFIGYSQTDSWLIGFAPIIGVNGLTFICCLISALFCWCFKREKKNIAIALVITLSFFASGLLLKQVNWVNNTDKKTVVSLIQANIPQNKKWDPDFLQETIDRYMTLSEPEWRKGGLVIWPESAMPRLYIYSEETFKEIAAHASNYNSGFMSGVITHKINSDGYADYYNSIMGFASADGIYSKRHLVPFGEVVPFANLLKPLGSIFSLPMSSFARGDATQQPLTFNGLRFSPYICYEIIYPQYIIRDIKQTDVLLTISNDTWFGNSHGPWQHVQMAQMRAIESARYLVRANNNGFSAIIDHKGNIVKHSTNFKQDTISGEVFAMEGLTPFMRLGQWPMIVLVLLSSLICYFKVRLSNKSVE